MTAVTWQSCDAGACESRFDCLQRVTFAVYGDLAINSFSDKLSAFLKRCCCRIWRRALLEKRTLKQEMYCGKRARFITAAVCAIAPCAQTLRERKPVRATGTAQPSPPRAGSPCPVRAIEGARVINYIKAVAELPLGSCCWTKRACFRPHQRLPDLHLWPRARAKRMFWPVAFTTPALAQMSSTPLSYRVILCSPVCLLASCAVAA